MFSVINSLYLRALPVPTGDRLIRVEFDRPGRNPALGLAAVHGIAMLAIDGQLGPDPDAGLALYRDSAPRIRAGLT